MEHHQTTERALLDLLAGEPGRAVEILERERASLDEPWMWSDLGVARAADREHRSSAVALLDGLAAVEIALDIEPTLPEALFNEANLLEQLHLVTQAQSAWSRYLEVDADSQWADEARRRLADLQDNEASRWERDQERLFSRELPTEARRELVALYRQRVRLEVEDRLLPEWGQAWLVNDRESASRLLGLAEAQARALRDVGGDPMLTDSVSAIREAVEAGQEERLGQLASGHRGYGEGMLLYGEARDWMARERFASAATSLGSAGSPYAGWARFRQILCRYYAGENEEVLSEVSNLLSVYPEKSSPALAGRTYLLRGMANLRLARLGDAIGAYRTALELFDRIGESEHVAAAHFMLAEAWSFHGEGRRAWDHRLRALEMASPIGNAVYYYTSLFDGAQALHESGDLSSALRFENEMLNWGESTQDDLVVVESLGVRARTHAELGDAASARADIEKGRELLARLPEGERRLRLDLAFRRAEAESMLGSRSATEQVSAILDWARQRDDEFRLPELYGLRARSLLAQERTAEAAADLRAAIESAEDQAERALDDPLAGSFFDQRSELFRQMVELQLGQGEMDRAFHYFERGRTRSLRKDLARHREAVGEHAWADEQPASLKELALSLPGPRALVVFAVLRDKTVVWVLGNGRWRVRELPVSKDQIARSVDLLGNGVESGREFRRASGELFDLLWRPILTDLESFDEVVIVPDGSISMVPFAALWDREMGRWLVERWTVLTAPSATLYLRALDRDVARVNRNLSSALAIGSPTLAGTAYSEFPELPEAKIEAQEVGDLYPDSIVLTGDIATKTSFLEAAQSRQVIHVATHGIVNQRNPFMSALLLAPTFPEIESDGALYAHEIYDLSLASAAVVVLSACQTGAGRVSTTEGVDSLARAFLGAGATTVLGTLWPVDDMTARSFANRFHERVVAGQDPMRAVRETQLTLIAEFSDEEPPTWAAYQLIGGVAERGADH